MSLGFAAIVLLAAVLHAIWNAIVKTGEDRMLTLTLVIGAGAVMAAPVLLFIEPPAPESWPYLFLSSALHTAYYFLLIRAYHYGDLSLVYPVSRGSAPLLVAFGAAAFFSEVPTTMELGGLILASLGIAAFALERKKGEDWDYRPFLYGLTIAAFVSAYTLADGIGVRLSGNPLSFILWLFFVYALPLIFSSLIFKRREFIPYLREHWWRTGVVGGGMCAIAYALVVWALMYAPMAHVSAMRETSVVFAALIGMFALGESFGPRRIIAALIVTAGLIIMQLFG
jgi:drug/metabolite transporter (DMT)-like permease